MKTNILPSPWDLHYFQEAAATQNLSRTAERLAISQPALSLSLKRLEETLDTKLFLRKRDGLELTESGQILLLQSQALLAGWKKLTVDISKTKEEVSGRFRIGCHSSVAMYALKSVIPEIYRKFPTIEIQLVHQLSRVICEQVISGNIEFGLAINPVAHPDLVIYRLLSDEVGFWKSEGAAEDVLIYDPALVQSQNLLKKVKKTFKRTLVSDNLEVLAMLAKTGVGIAILPGRVAEQHGLKRIKSNFRFEDTLSLIYRSDLIKSAATRALIEELKALKN
jgi:LysR family transcriptional regulator, cell division regulator